jgi:hypothetical protein
MYTRILTILFSFAVYFATAQELKDQLKPLINNYNLTIEILDHGEFFNEKYLITLNQPLNHKIPAGPSFEQRFFISHKSLDLPVVVITEGYAANYGLNPNHVNEICQLIPSNQILIEHRFFGQSIPDSIDWSALTVHNAAADHHRIIEILKQIYQGKWISTGISKGGQTSIFHRSIYPEDVDITIPYVAPLNFSIEDKRVYRFLENVGDSICRSKIHSYQLEMLKNKDKYLVEFINLAKEKDLNFPMGWEKGYELTVFEYSFAFWQWGAKCSSIPEGDNSSKEMIAHLNTIADISWVSEAGIKDMQAFFYQALVEIGFYGYDITPFQSFVSFSDNPTFTFTAPEGTYPVYNPITMETVDHFIRHDAENMIFIYGEFDPWSSTAVDLTYNSNLIKIIKPGGSHTTRIKNLPDSQKNLIVKTIKEWLNEN